MLKHFRLKEKSSLSYSVIKFLTIISNSVVAQIVSRSRLSTLKHISELPLKNKNIKWSYVYDYHLFLVIVNNSQTYFDLRI